MRLWRNNSGLLWAPGAGGTMRRVRASAEGAPDIIGLLRGGRFLGIECKTEEGRQDPAQKMFQKMIESMGGLYILARSVEDVKRQLPEGWDR
jgi:4-aminobutyrate aminotransferase-like enzyme